jgi:hypothetical protein
MSVELKNGWIYIPHRPGAITFDMSNHTFPEPSFMMASGQVYIFSTAEQLQVHKLLREAGASSGVITDYLRTFQSDSDFPDLTHYLSIAMLARGYKSGALLPYHRPNKLKETSAAIDSIQSDLSSMANQVIYSAAYLLDSTIPSTVPTHIYIRPSIKGETI